jgi:uncharacterized protein DUF5658
MVDSAGPAIRPRDVDHRQAPDRRRQPTPMISRYQFWGRRRGGRRQAEHYRIYVDRPGRWVIIACALVIALSIADAHVTLSILGDGGAEINPVMRAVLALGERPFLIVKLALTLTGAAVLYLHNTWPLGRVSVWIALGGYGALTGYHMVIHVMQRWAG